MAIARYLRCLPLGFATFFIFSTSWFCLWSIGLHLVQKPDMAALLFTFGLRCGLMLQSPQRYWPLLLCSEWLLLAGLHAEVGLPGWPRLVAGSLLTVYPLLWLRQRPQRNDVHTLLWQGAALVLCALLQAMLWLDIPAQSMTVLLLTLSGGLTVAPACLLFWHYLSRATWVPLGPALVEQPVSWRARHLLWYLLLFTLSLGLQLGLPGELARFTPFCLALPIMALAWRYGWQGALMATLMNAIALIAGQTLHDHAVDLLLSLLAQSLTGLLLGAGIQRLRDLNAELSQQLTRNRQLTERLVETEEQVRREVARELHDDIGQTITAIRTQATILPRLLPGQERVAASSRQIEQLSLDVYDAVRRLLGRLRPRQLDDLSLSAAVRSLLRELELDAQGIVSHLDWQIVDSELSDSQGVTLFRICQEALNNIIKHAGACAVTLHAWREDNRFHLVIEDDGCGLPLDATRQGYGLRGLNERVQAMGGKLQLTCTHGVRLAVTLPVRLDQESL